MKMKLVTSDPEGSPDRYVREDDWQPTMRHGLDRLDIVVLHDIPPAERHAQLDVR